MLDAAADAHAWAQKHGVVLSATRLHKPPDGESWCVEACTAFGVYAVQLDTDGSYQPDPFAVLFGSWADLTPDDDDYTAAARALGPAALADLARLLGWL